VALPGYSVTLWIGASVAAADAATMNAAAVDTHLCLNVMLFLLDVDLSSLANGLCEKSNEM
jgi:hypothetical protein